MRQWFAKHDLHIFFIGVIILWDCAVFGQTGDTWVAFYNQDSTLVGYKDSEKNIKIEPRFMEFAIPIKFDNIIAATENDDGKWTSYYLNKTGQKFGRDSLYFFDNAPDCENERFIRFRDRESDKVGLFNRYGEIIVPAVYNDLTKVRNGMLVGLKGAQKKYEHEQPYEGDNYYTWVGGQEVLIDTLNNILAEDFPIDYRIDFYSLEKSQQPADDSVRRSFRGQDGQYFTFVDFEKEFKYWLMDSLLQNLTKTALQRVTADTVLWEAADGWAKSDRSDFIKNNFDLLKNRLLDIRSPQADYFTTLGGLNPFMYEGEDHEQYFNNCGEAKEWQYPVFTVVLSYQGEKSLQQNHFDFLRTDVGYKLISVTIRTGEKIRGDAHGTIK